MAFAQLEDLEGALGRPVRLANDANCFALSEAVDGAAQGAEVVFGVILGTGVGGGIVADSDPELEYRETLHKVQGIVRTLADRPA